VTLSGRKKKVKLLKGNVFHYWGCFPLDLLEGFGKQMWFEFPPRQINLIQFWSTSTMINTVFMEI
jgi:hypothetical protein